MRVRDLCSGKILVIVVAILGTTWLWAGAPWAATTTKPVNHAAGVADPGKAPAPTSFVTPDKTRLLENYSRQPLYFIENRGQVASEVRYYLQGPGPRIAFTSREAALSLNQGQGQAAQIRLTPLGMRPGVQVKGLAPQAAKFNYLLGNDPQQWRTEVPTCGAVLYQEAYPGIDLKFYGTGKQLEYDVIVHPGADPGKVKFRCEGARGVKVNGDGDLVIALPGGREFLQRKPLVYQEIDGRRVERAGSFRLAEESGNYGFSLGPYDPRHTLVIDPVLAFSTYFGNQGQDILKGMAVDGAGSVYVVGCTEDEDFPDTTLIAPFYFLSPTKVFVAKFTANGALVYATQMAGSNQNYGMGIAVDQDGHAFIAGNTSSTDFPVTPGAYLTSGIGGFVAKLNTTGSGLIYSTFLGGGYISAIALNQAGEAYVTGYTGTSFPPATPLAFQSTYKGGKDAFVVQLNAAGSGLIYATYLGGTGEDMANGIALTSLGDIVVTGHTKSSDFPLEKAFQTTLGGSQDAFVTRIGAPGEPLASLRTFSTYLGGGGDDVAYGVAVDENGGCYITGETKSTDFPLSKPIINNYGGGASDAFVTKVALKYFPQPPVLIKEYSTYLGGTSIDTASVIAVDDQGCAYVSGTTYSDNFPTRNPLFPYKYCDVFVTKINAAGSAWLFSTTLGGSGLDFGQAIALDRAKNIYVAGWTKSNNFPTVRAWQKTYTSSTGEFITFLAKIRLFVGVAPVNYLLLQD
jgi:hypothetical protein